MRGKRASLIVTLLLLVALGGGLGWLTYREIRQERLNRSLIAAVKQNDTSAVLALLNEGADANAHDMRATSTSLWKQLMVLLRGKPFPSSHAPTALLVALQWHHDSNSDIEFPPGNLRLIKVLLDKGAAVNAEDSRGNTPLLYASVAGAITEGGRDKIINLLLDHGANVNPSPHFRQSPLMWAVMGPYVSEAVITRMVNQGADINAQNLIGQTPLMYAVQEERLRVVRLLIKHHANPNIKDSDGKTAIYYARVDAVSAKQHLYNANINVNRQIVHMLKQAGAKE